MKRPPLVSYDTYPFAWVTPSELASYVQCDPRTIVRMIGLGSIIAFRVGRRWRITIKEARRVFPVELHKPASQHISGTSHDQA